MHAIAIKIDGKYSYWCGGKIFDADADAALRFIQAIDAEGTIPILMAGLGGTPHPCVQVVTLPDED